NNSTIYAAKSILMQQGKLFLTFGPSRQEYHSGDTTITRVYVRNLSGNPAPNVGLNYHIYQSQYQQQSGSYAETTLREGFAKSDGSGLAIIKEQLTTGFGAVNISVSAHDPDGRMITSERSISFIDPKAIQSTLYYHNLTLSNFDVST